MPIDKSLLDAIVVLAKKAGKEILTIYNQQLPLKIKLKEDLSPVTQADLKAHEIICRGLKELTPDIPLLSEEDSNIDYTIREQWQRYWLVDPLDGTREFINRSEQYTVNIALIENHVPVLGVIYIPAQHRTFFACDGIGAFHEDDVGKITPLKVRPWQPGEQLVIVATRREIHPEFYERVAAISPVKLTYRSSSIKFCLVAKGKADLYLRKKPIQEWDTAAGHSIVVNAGGVVLDSNWQPLRYNTKPQLLSPPFIVLGDTKQLLPFVKSMPMF